jgi:predicted RNA-binding Zn-ribbon protein involved in translation (DUF1610 family)
MPTQNRRVATYLPSYIDEPFKTFKAQRDIKGDSEALIAILSEYLQVSQEVAYPSSLNLLQRIEAVEGKLGSLKGELLSELESLQSKPQQTELLSSSKDKLLSKPKELQPQTAPLFPEDVQNDSSSKPKSDLPVETLEKPKCPRCGSEHFRKNGTAKGFQNYKCVDCSKFFRGHSLSAIS